MRYARPMNHDLDDLTTEAAHALRYRNPRPLLSSVRLYGAERVRLTVYDRDTRQRAVGIGATVLEAARNMRSKVP